MWRDSDALEQRVHAWRSRRLRNIKSPSLKTPTSSLKHSPAQRSSLSLNVSKSTWNYGTDGARLPTSLSRHPASLCTGFTPMLIPLVHLPRSASDSISTHSSKCLFPIRAILLALLKSGFLVLEAIPIESQLPLSLATVHRQLDLEDRFTVFPICQKCHKFSQRHCTRCAATTSKSFRRSWWAP